MSDKDTIAVLRARVRTLAGAADALGRLLERSELDLQVQVKQYEVLKEKANNLARLCEQVAYAPVAGYYEQVGNDAPLRLLRLAVEDIDGLTQKGGARGPTR